MRVDASGAPTPAGGGVRDELVFIGVSRPLREALGQAQGLGYAPAAQPHARVRCLVADEDVLDGFCTPGEAQILQQARVLGLPCVSPAEVPEHLGGSNRHHVNI